MAGSMRAFPLNSEYTEGEGEGILNLCVTADRHWAIGKDGRPLVTIPADRQMFLKETAGKVLLDASPRSNPLRGSREYRMEVLPVLIERALEDIAQQLSLKAERRSGSWQNC